jgi:uncharacterized protein YraI
MLNKHLACGATFGALVLTAAMFASPALAQTAPSATETQTPRAQMPSGPAAPSTMAPGQPVAPPAATAPVPPPAPLPAIAAQTPEAPRTAYAATNLNLRSGPGTDTPILATIPAGSAVQMSNCSGEWCTVQWNGNSGYAVARNLAAQKPRPVRRYVARPYYEPAPEVAYGPPVYYYPRPRVYYRPYYYGPRYYYGPGWGWRRRW